MTRYIRVSTDKQTVENQKFEINEYCKKNNLKIDGYIQETISGNKTYRKRELGKLLYKVQSDDLIICAELSRLGRNLFMIMEILNICMSKGCRVWTIKDNYKLGDDIQSKVLAFAFGLSAEIERNLISQRTKEALARIKSEGKSIGRRQGSKNKFSKLSGKAKIINRMLDEGFTVSQISLKILVHRSTIYKYLKETGYNINEKQLHLRQKVSSSSRI